MLAMGGQNGKFRRNQNGLRPESDASLYGLCMGQASQVFYSKSLENCSLKLYRTESANGNTGSQDEVVVLLDCGGRVYANGRRVYPFDNSTGGIGCMSTSALDIPAECPNVRWSGEIARIPGDSYKIIGGDDKHIQPGDYAGALNTLLALISETFDQLLKDGLKLQENIRVLEEENTALSLKVLELKREQLHTQKLELEKKKLELRIEELEAKKSLGTSVAYPRRKVTNLVRTGSLGHSEVRLRTLELEAACRQDRAVNGINGVNHDNDTVQMRPRSSAMCRIRQIENEREEINKESAVLQFQLDRLASEHKSTKTTIKNTSPQRRSPPLTTQLSNGSTSNGHGGGITRNQLGSSNSLKHRAITQCQENGSRAHSSMEELNISFDGGNGDKYEKLDGTWERYDTLKRRYEDLKQRRLLRMNRFASSQDDVVTGSNSPRTARRAPLPMAPGSSATINGYLSASNGSPENRRGSSDNSSENGYGSP